MIDGAGKTSHTMRTEEMVEHSVSLVEAKAAAPPTAATPPCRRSGRIRPEPTGAGSWGGGPVTFCY
jgi:hypothetical protein